MPIDWKEKIRGINCIQKENLIESLEIEIKKITQTKCPSCADYKIDRVIVSVYIFESNILKNDLEIQPSLFIFGMNDCQKYKKICLNISIQEYLSCRGFGGPYGKPKEYFISSINDGFGWSIKETKKMN